MKNICLICFLQLLLNVPAGAFSAAAATGDSLNRPAKPVVLLPKVRVYLMRQESQMLSGKIYEWTDTSLFLITQKSSAWRGDTVQIWASEISKIVFSKKRGPFKEIARVLGKVFFLIAGGSAFMGVGSIYSGDEIDRPLGVAFALGSVLYFGAIGGALLSSSTPKKAEFNINGAINRFYETRTFYIASRNHSK